MDRLIDLMNHPFLSTNLGRDVDDVPKAGLDPIYPLTLFFAMGIWLVYERYQKLHNSPLHFEISPPIAADPSWQSLPIENPSIRSHETNPDIMPPVALPGREYITCFDPATSLHLATVLADDAELISDKIDKAADAQRTWKHTSFTERRRVLRSLLKWLVDNQELCAKVACRDTGKTLIDASLGEILTTCSKLEWILNHGEAALRPEARRSNLMMSYKRSEVHYEPLGVVAAIVSWNYPLHNAWSPIMAAIFAGNGIVLKCSENVVWSTSWFVEAIQGALRVCGHDPELVQLVCCYPDQANALIQSPKIKHITFIGSETVGRKVAQAATKHLTPVTLELGGKDPAIILPGTDIPSIASILLRGVYQNMGQNCIGIERIIVHSSVYDELWAIFEEKVSRMRVGSVLAQTNEGYIPTVDGGAMINPDRFRGLEKVIHDAEEGGAQVIGGEQYNHVYLENGYYFAPTIVGPVDKSMEIANHELFAPIALFMPYDKIEEAIEIANGTKYGLGASVWGPHQDVCLKVAKKLECGMVSINDFGVFYINQDLPFGGVKASGYGRFGGPEGLRSLTNPKAIITDRWWIHTSIPKVLDYPLRSLSTSWEFSAALVRFLYGFGWRTRFAGLITVARNANK
ncbi:meiotic Sister-Chromatid recombination aldehyde dehydrogenase [Coprinopsis cinerea okayama7|uniref:Meiotic Sister-Chromatid recombination aldehyde dehydrogenase n=1 Tax=Coprinopsis cinerea (strain Okayama-7 / 130 / ATCC MYA-4618 / FGSC 9003) TaxID=240176 RepID=A8NH17_COPC7|nr:meiotic Sister-Chromatid recombination aldehyde dehydrogenase [Coprinopsis cinerea okayama7\|eukprot:XP_001833656.1 meiotic Sister-Chromatid recombination aldehyde dehydrogenase [Coprinopsis cinerea okayama7\